MQIVGYILAGGKATRMQEKDKGLVSFNDQPLILPTLNHIKPWVDLLAINCNRNHDIYKKLSDKIVPDLNKNFEGPLAGIAAGMNAFADKSALLIATCDSPLLPPDFAQRLIAQHRLTPDSIVLAETQEKIHPLHGIYPVSFANSINDALAQGQRGVFRWLKNQPVKLVVFNGPDYWFSNANTLKEITTLENINAAS